MGAECYASHDGIITYADTDGTGGISIQITNEQEHYRTIYYHLKDFVVKVGDEVRSGDLIAHTDNTGKYTTGSHLHFGFKLLDNNNLNTINYNNGYLGAVNPAPYFHYTYNGIEINPKDWSKSRCYHRYYRGRPKGGYTNELKVVASLTPYLRRLPTNEEINACTYGGWDRQSLINPSMYVLWSQLKKSEYLAGEKPFNAGIGSD